MLFRLRNGHNILSGTASLQYPLSWLSVLVEFPMALGIFIR